MKKTLATLSLPIALLSSNLSHAAFEGFDKDLLQPYLGIDFQARDQHFADGLSKNLFQKSGFKNLRGQANLFAGIKFCDHLGLELSFQQSQKAHKHFAANLGDDYYGPLLGQFTFGIQTIQVTSKNTYQSNAINLMLMGYLPLVENTTNLYGGIGLSRAHVNLSHQILTSTNTQGIVTTYGDDDIQKFSATRYIPKVTVGVEQCLTKHFSVRAHATWENTSRFKNLTPKSFDSRVGEAVVSLKDAFSYGIGLSYKF